VYVGIFLNRDFLCGENYHLCRDILNRDFSIWGETEVPVELKYLFYMANVGIFYLGIFLCGENCHLCREFLHGDILKWGELHGGFWRIIAGKFSLIFQFLPVQSNKPYTSTCHCKITRLILVRNQ
jgi:hypothetical protein